jgi:predicted transcriptional regulator
MTQRRYVQLLATTIRAAMRERGLTIRDAADLSGIPKTTVHKIISHRPRAAQAYTVQRLCESLGIELPKIFGKSC